METRGDARPTVRITFTERHLILMLITGERLQNLQNIVNAVVIKVDCQSVWQSTCPPRVLSLLQESSLETTRTFQISRNERDDVYSGNELHQNVTECLTSGAQPAQSGALFSVCRWGGRLGRFCLWDVFNTSPLRPEWPVWSSDLCRVCKDTSIIYWIEPKAIRSFEIWGQNLQRDVLTRRNTNTVFWWMEQLMRLSLHKGIASLLTMNYRMVLWVMKVKLLHTAEYYKPQLLSSGGVITGVWLTLCFYLTGFPLHVFFCCAPVREKDFPAWWLVMQSDMSGGYVITEQPLWWRGETITALLSAGHLPQPPGPLMAAWEGL